MKRQIALRLAYSASSPFLSTVPFILQKPFSDARYSIEGNLPDLGMRWTFALGVPARKGTGRNAKALRRFKMVYVAFEQFRHCIVLSVEELGA
jgi:hypothetical protein